MNQLQDREPVEQEEGEQFYSESLLSEIVLSYQNSLNRGNDKYEFQYLLTTTTHKVPTEEGNKDVAYLRLVRRKRSRAQPLIDPNMPEELKPPVPQWEEQLIHTEAYPFRDMKERLNPEQRWKDYLYQSCIARLIAAGLEYAELLQKLKQQETQKEEEKPESNLVITDQMPKPLTPAEEKYKGWVLEERQKLGL